MTVFKKHTFKFKWHFSHNGFGMSKNTKLCDS